MELHQLVLASASPRRRELMASLDLPFEAIEPEVDEAALHHLPPLRQARTAAALKAAAAAARRQGALVVAADTIVSLGGHAFGKPAGPEEARAMLLRLRGRTHAVFTAVQVVYGERRSAGYSRTLVSMRVYTEREISRYVASGEPLDKAGAYGIQGRGGRLVADFRGPFDNVVGLPMALVRRLLTETAAGAR